MYVLILPNKHQSINHATFLALITYLFLLNEAIVNVPTYFSSSAFLSIKLEGFIVPEANLIALLTLVARIHFAKFHFPLKYLTCADILLIKLELYCALARKKINTGLAFVYYTNGNEMDQMVRNEIACNCIPIGGIAFRYAHI